MDDLALDTNLASLGLTSTALVNFAGEFERKYECSVPIHHLFACSTLAEVLELLSNKLSAKSLTPRSAAAVEATVSSSATLTAPLSTSSSSNGDAPSIAGIGLKLPGGITEMSDLWDAIQRQESTIRPVPTDDQRFAGKELPSFASTFHQDDLKDLEEVADRFTPDVHFNELSLTERVALRVVASALSDANMLLSDESRNRLVIAPEAGVVGLIYSQGHVSLKSAPSKTLCTVSFAFRLKGPTFVTDTACSSGAVALDQALALLEQKRCDTVLILGVNLLRSMPKEVRGMLSKGSKVKSFDAEADGWVPGEAAACLVVTSKQCSEPHAQVFGTGVGMGYRFSPMAMSPEAAINAYSRAIQSSGVAVQDICLAELSGTASPLGDALELSAAQQLLQTPESKASSLVISATSPFFGHTAHAAPLIQICKLVTELRVGQVPANPSTTNLNPEFAWADFPRAQFPLGSAVATLPEQSIRYGLTCSLSAAGPIGCVILGVAVDGE